MNSETERLIPYVPELPTQYNNYGSNELHIERDTMGLQTVSSKNGEARKLPQYIAALSATLGALAAGSVLGYTSPTDKELKEGALGFKISPSEWDWIASLTALGCMVMCMPVGKLLDLIGRKITMLSVILIFAVGWALIIFASNVGMLMAGRFFTGMASGTFCVAAPLYTSEIAQKEIRGALGSYFQLMITVGILFAYVTGDIFKPQGTAIACGVLPFVFGIAFVFMPESPVYLLKKGNIKKAEENLQRLRGANYDISDEIKELQKELEDANSSPVSFKESLQKKSSKKALLICFGLMFFQQLSGVNAVIFFSSDIFRQAGISLPSKEGAIIVAAMQVLATLLSTIVIDKWGRKILLMISIGIMSICTLMLGVYFSLIHDWSEAEIKEIGWLPVLSLSVFIVVFSLGFGPIPWMISAEVLPKELKNIISAAAGTFNWFLAFIIIMFYNGLAEEIGTDVTFYVFTGICIAGIGFVYFVVLETKGKSLSQIQQELGSKSPHVSTDGVVNEGFTAT